MTGKGIIMDLIIMASLKNTIYKYYAIVFLNGFNYKVKSNTGKIYHNLW